MNIREQNIDYTNLSVNLLFLDDEGVAVIIFSGSMDTDPIVKLQKKIDTEMYNRQFNLIVDMNHVQYISSTGLGFLMYLMKVRKDFLYLSYPNEIVLRSFELLNLDEVFMFYHSYDELKEKATVSDVVIEMLRNRNKTIRNVQYRKRWVKILRDYLDHTEVIEEIQKMTPFIRQADHEESIMLPSEEKYACILYKFLYRVFSKIAKINSYEVDDMTIEMIAKELMTNAVKHGYNYKKDGVVEANYKFNGEKVEINIIDYGKGFSPSLYSHDVLPSAGLQILKKIFDSVNISEAPKKDVEGLVIGEGTMVKMTKHIKKKNP
jgi:anti-anti-sigma factor